MTDRPHPVQLASALLPILEAAVGARDRWLLGLAGPPGAGKSALATALVAAYRAEHGQHTAVVVGMDGFHLSQQELRRRGLDHVKGAPETFDAQGFVRLLKRLRDRTSPVPAPVFDRTLEEPVDSGVTVHPSHRLVAVEGNYLLLDGPWADCRQLLDAVWYLALPDPTRVPLLIERHVRHGRTLDQATEWVHRSDEANARLVAGEADRADAIVDLLTGSLSRPSAGRPTSRAATSK